MARKRERYAYQSDRDRNRKRDAKGGPPPGWTLDELASAAGITGRTVRYYLEVKALPKAVARGVSTRYERKHLLYLLAIQRLKRETKLSLAAIRKRIDEMKGAALEAFAAPPAPSTQPAAETLQNRVPADTWHRLALLPGLELHLKSDASPHVARFAQEVWAHCAAPGASEPPWLRR